MSYASVLMESVAGATATAAPQFRQAAILAIASLHRLHRHTLRSVLTLDHRLHFPAVLLPPFFTTVAFLTLAFFLEKN
jgi:hypothetical protein